MAKYIALERGQIPANVAPAKRPDMTGARHVMRMVEVGEVFDYDGKRGSWMAPYKPENDDEGNVPGRKSKNTTSAVGSPQTAPGDSPASGAQGKQSGHTSA